MRYCTRSILNFSFFYNFLSLSSFQFFFFFFQSAASLCSLLLLSLSRCLSFIHSVSLFFDFIFRFFCYWPVACSICLSVCPSVSAKRYFISSRSNTVIDKTRRREGLKWKRLQREGLKRFVLVKPKKNLDFKVPPAVAFLNKDKLQRGHSQIFSLTRTYRGFSPYTKRGAAKLPWGGGGGCAPQKMGAPDADYYSGIQRIGWLWLCLLSVYNFTRMCNKNNGLENTCDEETL